MSSNNSRSDSSSNNSNNNRRSVEDVSSAPTSTPTATATAAAGYLSSIGKYGRERLHEAVTASVQGTNQVLAQLEQTTQQVTTPLAHIIQDVSHQGQSIVNDASRWYQYGKREYGPHIVVGSAITIGGIMAMRRGRFVGAASGLATGGLVYWMMYEQAELALDQTIPDIIFGKKD